MDFGPIFTTLRRHRTAAALIVLEIAFTCAIVSNAIYLISERITRMHQPSGVAESELLRIQITGPGKQADAQAVILEDIAVLDSIPGVRKAACTRQLPFGYNSRNSGVKLKPDDPNTRLNSTFYVGCEGLLETLGVQLVAGRDFTREDYIDEEEALMMLKTAPIIVTRALVERLWPGQPGVGQTLYLGDNRLQVIGVMERLVRPSKNFGAASSELSIVLPIRERHWSIIDYVLRVDPARRAEVLRAATTLLEQSRPGRIILEKQTLEDMRNKYYRGDRAMAWLLVSVCAALLIVTALGIVGLASFWVQQRTRQIGIRRALGASRSQIVLYFQAENFLLATLGIALGMLLAFGINQLLMERYEVGRLPAQYLPVGALSLWVLGQLAALGPALRAASVPPAVATRTV